RRHRLPAKGVSTSGKQRLLSYPWPGNVRELSHELERAIVFEDHDELAFDNLKSQIDPAKPMESAAWLNPSFSFPPEGFSLEQAMGTFVQHALKQSGNNVSAAARLLGVSRDYLRYRLKGK